MNHCKNTTEEYGCVSKFFHWLLFILITIMLIVGFCLELIPNKELKGTAIFFHKATGLLILMLMLVRLFWASANEQPIFPDSMRMIQKVLARLMHAALYLAVIAMPLTGILLSSYAGHPPSFYGLFTLELPIMPDKAMAKAFGEIHGLVALTLISLIVLHVLAALKHHFIDKDNILKRMMPKCSKCK